MTEVLQRPAEDNDLAGGLGRYVDEVATALGVGREACSVDPNPPVSLRIGLGARLSRFPGREIALLWDERFGWCVAVARGEGSNVVAYQGGDLLPYPADLTAFVAGVAAGRRVGQKMPPHVSAAAREDMAQRLYVYR